MKKLIFILTLLFAMPGYSETTGEPATAGPDITIRHGGDRTLYEYRANGVLYAIRVEPKDAPAYYLVDPDGSGNYIRSDKTKILIPSWVILEW